MISSSNSLSRGSGMPIQVDGALRRAPCPVQSCPACEPNSGSVHPNLPAKADRVERGPTLLCNQVVSDLSEGLRANRGKDLKLCHRCHEFAVKSSKIVPLGAPLLLSYPQSVTPKFPPELLPHFL